MRRRAPAAAAAAALAAACAAGVAAAGLSGSGCTAAQAAAVAPAARCMQLLLSTGACAAGCCCVRTAPRATRFAQAGTCYVERAVRDDDVAEFRVLAAAPRHAGGSGCGEVDAAACGEEACKLDASEDEVLAEGRGAAVVEGADGGEAAADGGSADGDSDGDGDGGGGGGKAAIFGGVFGGLGAILLALAAVALVLLSRRRKAALAGLQPPAPGIAAPAV